MLIPTDKNRNASSLNLLVVLPTVSTFVFRRPSIFVHFQHAEAGADSASKFTGGSQNNFTAIREIKYTSQNCRDKTVDNRIALYRECCFPNGTKSMVNKVTFVCFRAAVGNLWLASQMWLF